jgi:hypothetical protein
MKIIKRNVIRKSAKRQVRKGVADLSFNVYARGKEKDRIVNVWKLSNKAMDTLNVRGELGIVFGHDNGANFILVTDKENASALVARKDSILKASSFAFPDAEKLFIEQGIFPATLEVGYSKKFNLVEHKLSETEKNELGIVSAFEIVSTDEEVEAEAKEEAYSMFE